MVDLNPVAEKSVFLVQHKLDLAGVEARLDLAPDLKPVEADPVQLQQALMALVINACEAMEGGGRVIVRTENAKEGVLLEVEDNGPGMPPEVAAHAFEPFFTTKTSGTGVGLGLSVVYGIIQRHGGSINTNKSPGGGCLFSITIPERSQGEIEEDGS
jgi:signal transduction histidine kinase